MSLDLSKQDLIKLSNIVKCDLRDYIALATYKNFSIQHVFPTTSPQELLHVARSLLGHADEYVGFHGSPLHGRWYFWRQRRCLFKCMRDADDRRFVEWP